LAEGVDAAKVADGPDSAVERGIAALHRVLGADGASSLLEVAPTRAGETASFYFPLPLDYTGTARRLRIGFPANFPRSQLKLLVEPSPWLVWPHAMQTGLCLHGFRQRPIMGSPETVVEDSLARLIKIAALSTMGSNEADRNAEFHNELTSYWSAQHGKSTQNLILLDRPSHASELFALSDPRQSVPPGQETIWLAAQDQALKEHYARVVGKTTKIRAAEMPGFYLKLRDFPSIRLPKPRDLLEWVMPNLVLADAAKFEAWFWSRGSLASRWIVLELPGLEDAPVYCLNVRSPGFKTERGTRFGLRALRRRPARLVDRTPSYVGASQVNVLDRSSIYSRDISGTVRSLEAVRVVCVGVGSIGGAVAMQLARSGVGHLTLIDPDTLVSANLGRHVLGVDDLGKSKAKALREVIRGHLPTVDVVAHESFSEAIQYEKPNVFADADLVINTTADWGSEVACWNAKAASASWALLQAWSEPHALVGHALLAPSGAFDARPLFEDNGRFKFRFTEWPEDGIIPLPGCGQSFIPAGALGITSIASMVSQAALRALTGKGNEPAWVSSICRPQDVAGLGGTYHGPAVDDSVLQLVLDRGWPSTTSLEQAP
jgi:hypothetical protein